MISFEFACGKWVADNPIPTDKNSWYLYQWVQDQNIQSLATILQNIDTSGDSVPDSVRKTKQAYDACVNYDPYVNNPYNAYLLNMTQNPRRGPPPTGWGGWPIITPNWTVADSGYEPMSYSGLIQTNHGVTTILNGYVDVDWGNTGQYIVFVDQGQLALGAREIYLNQTLYGNRIAAYKNLIIQTATVLGQDIGYDVVANKNQIEADAQAIIDVETKLAQLIVPDASRRNFTNQYNPMTVKQVKEMWPYLNWDLYFFHLLPGAFINRSNDTTEYFNGFYSLSNDSKVIIQAPDYITNLITILKQTDDRTMDNYFMWRFIMSLIPLMDNRIKSAFKEFKKATEFVEDLSPKEKQCVTDLMYLMPWTMGRLFVDQKFSSMDRNITNDMIRGAMDAMGYMFKSLTWLSISSTGNALTKLKDYVVNAGYPDWILNNTQLDMYYESLNLTYDDPTMQGNWYFIGQKLVAWSIEKVNLRLKDPVDRMDFGLSPAVTNAWYNPWLNSITISAGMLQPPLFRGDFPKVVNFGSMGAVTGHEITHGFDDQGSQFYVNGTLQAWIDDQSAVGFRQMADCVVNEYNQFCYTDPPLCLNGVNTQGENIADGGGLRQAFKAYQAFVQMNGQEPPLPGLEKYSMEQIFFISWASPFCGQARPDYIADMILLNPHTPSKYRVNGALMNFEEFGKAFSCQQGMDPMYPKQENTCYVWANPPGLSSSSPEFMQASQFYQGAVDFTVDPCEDFFDFACGAWIESHPIPPHRSTYHTYQMLQEQNFQGLAEFFKMTPPNATQTHDNIPLGKAVQKANWAFHSCFSSSNNELVGNKPILNLLSDWGGLPMIDPNWNVSNTGYDLASYVGLLAGNHGVQTLLSAFVNADWNTVDKYNLYVDQSSLLLPRDYYLNDTLFGKLVEASKNASMQIAMILANDNGVNTNDPGFQNQLKIDVDAIYAFEAVIAKIMIADADRRNYTQMYNPMKVKDMQTRWPFVDWNKYFFHLLPFKFCKICGGPNTTALTPDDVAIIVEPTFLDGLNTAINNIPDSDRPRFITNYLLWRLVMSLSDFLNAPGKQALMNFKKLQAGVEDLPPSDLSCVSTLTSLIGYAVGQVFVLHQFTDYDRGNASELIQAVQGQFKRMITGLDWMDMPSSQNAANKLKNIVQNIGYPDWIVDDAQLDAYYSSLMINTSVPISSTTWFDTYQMLLMWASQNSYGMYNQSVDRTDFQMSPVIVNAWYEPTYNSITFPASILQAPFFKAGFPMAVNLGAIGIVMGHETTHGFDDEGVQFDYNGMLHTWMSSDSYAGFLNMASCIVSEYHQFCPPEEPLCLNGQTNQGENIADNGGMREAYGAYQLWKMMNGEEKRLPGLEKFTMDQVFFLAFASFWCGSDSPSYIENLVLTNPHSPAKYRVLGTLKNFPEFGMAFNCKQGQNYMYPTSDQICYIWTSQPGLSDTSPAFMQASQVYLGNIDISVDPCDDFYEFACGTYRQTHTGITGTFRTLASQSFNNLILAVKDINNYYQPTPSSLMKTKMVFDKCLDAHEQFSTDAATQYVLKEFQMFGNWPIITLNWDANGHTAGEIAGYLTTYQALITFVDEAGFRRLRRRFKASLYNILV